MRNERRARMPFLLLCNPLALSLSFYRHQYLARVPAKSSPLLTTKGSDPRPTQYQTNSQQPSASSFREQIGKQEFITSGTGTGTVKMRDSRRSKCSSTGASYRSAAGFFIRSPCHGGGGFLMRTFYASPFVCLLLSCPGSWVQDK